jgi:uncharacterized coiled-coil protein SlyX
VLVAAAVVTGGPALAQEADAAPSTTPPTTTRPAPASPGRADPDAFRDLATQLNRNERELVELEARLAMAEARLVQLTDQLAETQRRLDATRAELERMRQIVRSRAAFIYSHSHTTTSIVVDIERVEDIASGKKYAESATRSDIGKIDQLAALADALDALRRQLEVDRNDQEAERDRLRDATDQLRALVAKQRRLLDEAGSITVIGDPELSAEQMAAWFDARGARYRLMGGTTIAQLAQLYVEEGAAERVRPELAFVQAILETGSFGNAVDNNFAGIGACDSCTGQIPFSSPREGVRGQIQMLRNYADPGSRAANLANPPSAPIYGSDPTRAANAYDTFFAKGRVPTWNLMGNGNWATDPGYAPKVLTLYFQLMSFATRRA